MRWRLTLGTEAAAGVALDSTLDRAQRFPFDEPPNIRSIMMAQIGHAADIEAYRAKGIHVIRSFFSEEVRQDFIRRAHDVIEMRKQGRLSTISQDARGLEYDWFSPIIHNRDLVALMVEILGPNVASDGCRILIKDRYFRNAVHVHQDWPYNPGDTTKAQAFIPITTVNRANGGLVFLEESHQYGPVQRGSIDISRFPSMTHVCPDVEPGDLVLADMLTWHYSSMAENEDERIMLQIYYQPASDPSSNVIVAGKRPHDKRLLLSRFDALGAPSTELNASEARAHFAAGDLDRAKRWATGLLKDDPDHAAAALLLHEVLSHEKNPEALTYLEAARSAMRRLNAQIAAHDQRLGITSQSSAVEQAIFHPERSNPWRGLGLSWHSYQPNYGHSEVLPAKFGTPANAWGYGAASGLVQTTVPSTIRVSAQALRGKIGICLISDDYTKMASAAHVITPDDGEANVMVAFTPDKSPARLVVRNHDDDGGLGEVLINSVELFEFS